MKTRVEQREVPARGGSSSSPTSSTVVRMLLLLSIGLSVVCSSSSSERSTVADEEKKAFFGALQLPEQFKTDMTTAQDVYPLVFTGFKGDVGEVLPTDEETFAKYRKLAVDELRRLQHIKDESETAIEESTSILNIFKQPLNYIQSNGQPLKVNRKTDRGTVQEAFVFGTNFYVMLETPDKFHNITFYQDVDKVTVVTGYSEIKKDYCTTQQETSTSSPSSDEYVVIENEPSLDEVQFVSNQGLNETTPPSTSSPTKVRVVSFNIWNYNSPWEERIKLIKEQLNREEIRPDVIGFQEVRYDIFTKWKASRDRSKLEKEFRFQVEHLRWALESDQDSQQTPYQFYYQPAMIDLEVYSGGFHVDEGLAFFSKLPMVNTNFIRLTRELSDNEDGHHRICQHVEVVTHCKNGEPKVLHLFNTHLSLSEKGRKRTIKEIWNFVNQYSMPQVIMGDFNDIEEGFGIQALTGNHPDEVSSDHLPFFRDAWREYQQKKSLAEEIGWTFSSDNLRKRIDFILIRGDIEVDSFDSFGKGETRTAVDNYGATASYFSSDHLGIVTNLILS